MWKPKITWPTTWRPTLPFSSNSLRRAWDGLLYVLLPNTCYSCKRDLHWQAKEPLCPACETAVKTVGPLYCLRCGKPLPDGGAHCYQCRGSKADHFKCKIIRSAVVFGPQVRGVVHAFKYADQPHLAGYLAQRMNKEWDKYVDLKEAELLIPVPLYKKKHKQRGYNQSELLAQQLAQMRGLPLDTQSLIRNRNTPSQTEFGREGRLQNMSGAFSCVNPAALKGKVVLLIDDVATTGATLEGCAEALKAAGAKKVMAYTLAREV
ncbi:MAG: ComF family protein [Elusimicrobiaceae bacterium]|nr:ComF family protein [Elusimicrobiaceae bacterium]